MLLHWTKFKVYKHCTLIGCFLILLCNAVPLYWGNLSIYIASYLRMKHDVKVKVMSAWILSIYMLAWDIPAFAVTVPAQKFGKRWAMLIGIALNETGLLLGWLSVVYPELPIDVGYGLFCGLGTCFTYTVSLMLAMDWSPEKTGLASGCLQAAIGVGGVITNQVVSYFINPANDEPIREGDYVPFFKETYINDAVPKFLFYNVVATFVISLFGFVLIHDTSSMNKTEMTEDHVKCKDSDTLALCQNTKDSKIPVETTGDSKVVHFSPIEILKTKTFYVLTVTVTVTSIVTVVSLTYYKAFGQAKNLDDYILTVMGTTSASVTVVGRAAFGAAFDRFGVQRPMIFMCALVSFSSALIYFTPDLSKWLYFLFVQLFTSGGSILHSCSITALMMLFGSYKFPIKLTMLLLLPDVVILCIPSMLEALILSFGWFWLFSLCAISSLVVLILISVWLR